MSINRPIILLFLATLIVALLFWAAFRRSQVVPGKFQNVMETVVAFVRDQIIGEIMDRREVARWVPYLTTLFCFVLVGNLFSVIPGIFFPVFFRSAFTWMLAIFSLFIFVWVGFRSQGPLAYLKTVVFPPGVPIAILPLIGLIEFVSTFLVRPLTLSVRLLANMIAGHFLLIIFWFGTAYLLQPAISAAFAGASFLLSVVLVAFEIFVATLQAFIFTILTAVYIAGAKEAGH